MDLQISDSEMEAFRGLMDWFATDHRPLMPYAQVECIQQGWGDVVFGKNLLGKPICLAGTEYESGLATHCDSIIRIRLTRPAVKFTALAGIDYNQDTRVKNLSGKFASAVFSVVAGGRTVWQSSELCVNDAPEAVEIDLRGVDEFCLHVKACDAIQFAHADWAGAAISYADGKEDFFTMDGCAGCSFLQLPVSFEYGGTKSDELLKDWDYKSGSEILDNGLRLHTMICSDPESGLECEVSLKEYADFPACWYQVKFRNTSDKNSAIISDIRSLDLRWRKDEQNRTFVTTWTGSNLAESDDFDSMRNFFEHQAVLEQEGLHLSGQLGRCSGSWLPFLNLDQGGRGLFAAVGWTGQWSCDVSCDRRHSTKIRAGMEKTHFILHAGEEVSQPSIMLMFLDDNSPIRRQNIFRRFMREHIIPKEHGSPVVTPISCTTWGGMPAELHLRAIEEIKKHSLPYEIYWIDAGWYGPAGNVSADEFSPGWVEHTGNWSVNPSIYPEGFKPISEAAHEAGMKFLVWMEPERACIGTPVTDQHPDWFLSDSDTLSRGVSVLLNLGNEQALKWLIELTSQFISDNGLDVYRQDFNYMPLASWRRNDLPDRQGITEIRHIEGLYRFWDELRNRFPNLMIDNCASGGRRIDIETMSRSVPLWASDVQCSPDHNPDASQVMNQGLNCFFNAHAIGMGLVSGSGDTYRFRSTMSEGMAFAFMAYERCWQDYDNYPIEWQKNMFSQFMRVRDFYSGDYYPLLPQTPDPRAWCAYEFWRDDLDSGIAVFFRREESPFNSGNFKLFVPDLEASYKLENVDTGETYIATGRTLAEAEGHSLTLSPRQASLVCIQKNDDR